MNIIVCVKQVPDTASSLKILPDGTAADLKEIQWVLNPYDEYAVEEGLRLKEQHGGSVTVITIGPEKAGEALRSCLAMGADEAVRIGGDSTDTLDSVTVARMLAETLRALEWDVILFGRQAVDGGAGAAGAAVAEILDLPFVSTVQKLDINAEGTASAQQEIEGGYRVIGVKLPAIFSAQKGLNTPRYASLPGIMKARKKDIRLIEGVTRLQNRNFKVSFNYPPKRQAGEILSGDLDAAVKQALALLKNKGAL